MSRYRSVFWPVVLIGVGVVALLGNLGLIPWDSLYRLLDLWPLILIVIGLELIIRRGLQPAAGRPLALAVVAAAVAVAIVYVAAAPAIPASDLPGTSTAPVGDLSKARLSMEVGAARISMRAEDLGSELYRAGFEYPAGQRPSITLQGDTLRIQDPGLKHRDFFHHQRRNLNLVLNSRLPWALEVSGGATSDNLDLRSLTLTGLRIDGGANRADVRLPRPQGTVEVRAAGGATHLDFHRPGGTEVSVHMTGGANSLEVDGSNRSTLGGDLAYSTGGYDSASDRYSVEVSGGATKVTLDTQG